MLQAWHDNNRDAGEALFERHYESVLRFFRNKVPEPADLVQRTFLGCLENIDRFGGKASFRTFLFSIANNLLHNHYRARSGPRGKVELGTVSVEDLGLSPSRLLASNDEKRLLLRALRSLTVDQQVLLELHYWEHLTMADLAEVLDLPVGTAKTRIRAARTRLRALLAELAVSPRLLESTETRLEDWADQLRGQLGQRDG